VKAIVEHADHPQFCPGIECPVVYFHGALEIIITEAEVHTRIGYKTRQAPLPVCYCIGVLEETIREEILVRGCCDSVEDIKRYTGARTGKLCHVTNPSGKCCGSLVRRVVEGALAERGATEVGNTVRAAAAAIPED
jgi:hypothetical protein